MQDIFYFRFEYFVFFFSFVCLLFCSSFRFCAGRFFVSLWCGRIPILFGESLDFGVFHLSLPHNFPCAILFFADYYILDFGDCLPNQQRWACGVWYGNAARLCAQAIRSSFVVAATQRKWRYLLFFLGDSIPLAYLLRITSICGVTRYR